MKRILLTTGEYTLISDEDFNKVNKWKWFFPQTISKDKYVKGHIYYKNGKKKSVRLHRWILDAPNNMVVDHIDGNVLNNQRNNLRICTRGQNALNKHKTTSNTSSKYIGVSWNTHWKKWSARITYDDRYYSLGYYHDEKQAALVRDEAAKRLHGDFAKLNFPNETASIDIQNFIIAKINGKSSAKLFSPTHSDIRYSGVKHSQYRGVTYDIKYKLWSAYITVNHKRYKLGSYNDEVKAAEMRDISELVLKDNYAQLNFPDKEYTNDELSIVRQLIQKIDNRILLSQYRGVSFRKEVKKFSASIAYKDKKLNLGTYKSEKEAAKIYDAALVILYPDKKHLTNFDVDSILDETLKIVQNRIDTIYSRKFGSEYKGVTLCNNRFRACIEIHDSTKRKGFKKVSLGIYDDEEQAAKMYDAALSILYPHKVYLSNFKIIDKQLVQKADEYINRKWELRSQYKGVSFHKHQQKWVAYILHEGKRIHVGYFETELDAYENREKKLNELNLK